MNRFIITNITLYLIDRLNFNKSKKLIIKSTVIFIYKQFKTDKKSNSL